MHRRRWLFLALLLLLPAGLLCKPDEPEPEEPPNTETGETLDPYEVVEVGLRPTAIRIDTATEFDLKAHARTRDGGFYDTLGGSWTVSDPAIATVDETGHLVPLATGEVTVGYTWQDFDAEPAVVEIVEPGRIELTVVSMIDGTPVAGAHVLLTQGGPTLAQGVSADDGTLALDGPFAGKVTLSAWTDGGYRHTSLAEVAPRQVRMPMMPAGDAYGSGRMSGQVEFTDTINPGDMAVAMAIPSVTGNPLSIGARDLLGTNRDLEGFGLAWSIPENVQINGLADTWLGDVLPGRRAVFAAGGVYDLSIALELALNLETYGTGALFPTMTQHIERLRFGVSEPLDVPHDADLTAIDFEMGTELPLETWVDMPPPPPGYYFPDPVLVLGWREYHDCGHVAVGFGTGRHPYVPEGDPPQDDDDDDDDATWTLIGGQLEERMWIPVREAARDGVFEDAPTRYFAFAWEDGVDYGTRATGVISSPTTQERVVLPDYLTLIETEDAEPGSWTFRWQTPPGTDFTWLGARPRCRSADVDSWHVFGPQMNEFQYPQGLPLIYTDDCSPTSGPGTSFYPEALALEVVSFQSLVNDHDEELRAFWEWVNRRTYASEWSPDTAFP